jgi:hypothetical protein
MALAAVETLSDEEAPRITTPDDVPQKDAKLESGKAEKPKSKPKPKAKSKGGGKGSEKKASMPEPEKVKSKGASAPKALKRPASAASAASAMKRPAASRDPDRVSTGKGLYKNGVWGIKLNKKEIIRVAWCVNIFHVWPVVIVCNWQIQEMMHHADVLFGKVGTNSLTFICSAGFR